jgi:hypothetical protein
MQCHICQAEAVARCYTCGELMCAAHGKDNCTRCANGVAAGDPRPDRVTAAVTANKTGRPGWWRPQPAEAYAPPACYACHGLTRAVCDHCRNHYCKEHAGPNGLCRACAGSAWVGPAVLGILFTAVVALLLWARFLGP